jgi:hypothetical protein
VRPLCSGRRRRERVGLRANVTYPSAGIGPVQTTLHEHCALRRGEDAHVVTEIGHSLRNMFAPESKSVISAKRINKYGCTRLRAER